MATRKVELNEFQKRLIVELVYEEIGRIKRIARRGLGYQSMIELEEYVKIYENIASRFLPDITNSDHPKIKEQ